MRVPALRPYYLTTSFDGLGNDVAGQAAFNLLLQQPLTQHEVR